MEENVGSHSEQSSPKQNCIYDPQEEHSQEYPFFQSLNYAYFAQTNSGKYPYFRSYHYFFVLDRFPRISTHPKFNTQEQAPGSLSYAYDASNAFELTYPRDQEQRGGQKINEIVNRKLFGCPLKDSTLHKDTKDKNPCHAYLFTHQDRNYEVDRTILLYKKLFKNFEKIKEEGSLNKFSLLKNNEALSPIISGSLNDEQCKQLLRNFLATLQQKKKQIETYHRRDAQLLFDASVNQKLYNRLDSYQQFLNINSVFSDILEVQKMRLNLILNKENKFMPDHLKELFFYFLSTEMCISDEKLKQFCQVADEGFTALTSNDNFSIDFPVVFFSFTNNKLFSFTQQLISCKLLSQNESSYYLFKSFWNKIFGRNIQQVRHDSLDYAIRLKEIGEKLKEYMQENEDETSFDEDYPILDDMVTLDQLQHKIADYIFSRKNQKDLTNREYMLLVYFAHLYNGLSKIYHFLQQNPVLIQFMGSPLYVKYHHYLINIVNQVQFSVILPLLERICGMVLRSEIQLKFKLGFNYDSAKSIVYIYRQSEDDEWEEDQISPNAHGSVDYDELLKKVKEQ